MARIFVSYRRDDASYAARSISDRLKKHFGVDEIFFDVDRSGGGTFPNRIRQAVGSCKAMVVVIGPKWLAARDRVGRPRLFKQDDWVRTECRMALERGILVIPTMVEKAELPTEDELPEDIRTLPQWDGIEIRHNQFDNDIQPLIAALEKKVPVKVSEPEAESSTSPNWSALIGKVVSSFVESRTAPPRISEPAGSSLARTIPGRWSLQIHYPNGMIAQAVATFAPGQFTAQGSSPLANFTIEGSWQADASDQISLRGSQFDGRQRTPYHAVIGFSRIDPDALAGTLNTGEQVFWRRMA